MSKLGDIAQLVERGLCKADVRSSSLLFSMELWFLIIPYSSTAEQRAVNSKVPRSNRGGGVGRTGNVRDFLLNPREFFLGT